MENKANAFLTLSNLEGFELVLNVNEISSYLFELLDCVAMNSLIELNLVSLNDNHHNIKSLSKQYRIQKYKDEISDRQIQTVTNLWNENKNQLQCRSLKITVPNKIDFTFDSLLQQVLDEEFRYAYSGTNLREVVTKWKAQDPQAKYTNKYSDTTESEICKLILDLQNYPFDEKFSFDNDLCIKMILLTVALSKVDSIFDIHNQVEYIIKRSQWNYNVILQVWCKLFIKQDLVDHFTSRKDVAPSQLRKLKHTFDTVFIGDEGSDEQDTRVMSAHLIKCSDIKNYNNEYAKTFTSSNMAECLENKKFGELILNEYAVDNEDFKLNPNILRVISDKVLCATYLKDIVSEWYCFDVKCMQRDKYDYINDIFSNYFYGVLSISKISEDENQSIHEIQFVEANISYYCNYES